MATKKPIALYDGEKREVASGDLLGVQYMHLSEETTPSTPATGLVFYAKSNNKIYILDSGGVETLLGPIDGGNVGQIVVHEFTTTGTIDVDADTLGLEVFLVPGGGGGGSGRRGAASTNRGGGGGGGGGVCVYRRFTAADLTVGTYAVTIAAGGTGGAAVTTDNTNGNVGTIGGDSTFATPGGTLLMRAKGGNPGNGGTTSGGTGGSGQNGGTTGVVPLAGMTGFTGNAGQSGGVTSGGNQTGSYPSPQTTIPGGAGGGGINSSNANGAGGAGSQCYTTFGATAQTSTTSGGSAGGGAGVSSPSTPDYPFLFNPYTHSGVGFARGASGGGGGDSGGTVAGGTGGDGSFGNGGAGGGASCNGADSGAGGTGGNGWCVIIEYRSDNP